MMPPSYIYPALYTGTFLLALNGLFAKGIPLDAITITQVRSSVAVIAIISVLLLWKRSLIITSRSKALGVGFLGMLMGLHWVTFFHAMQVSTVAIGMLSLFTFPVMIVLLESALHRKLPKWQDSLSALSVLLGIWLMTGMIDIDQSSLQGVFWGTVSALLFACRNVAQKYYFADISSDKLMLYQVATITLILLPFIDINNLQQLPPVHWFNIALLGIITTAGAHTLLVMSYKHLPAKTVAMISCLQPVIGAGVAWLLLAEQPTKMIILGGGIILAVAIYESVNRQKL